MTEDQWNSCRDPAEMLDFLRSTGQLTERKARLFAAACCRRMPLVPEEDAQTKIDVAERYADGLASSAELSNPYPILSMEGIEEYEARRSKEWLRVRDMEWGDAKAVMSASEAVAFVVAPTSHNIDIRSMAWNTSRFAAWAAAWKLAGAAKSSSDAERWAFSWNAVEADEFREQANLVRDIFGNPFNPPSPIAPPVLTSNVRQLALASYNERILPSGTLDNAKLAALAEALTAAGCQDAELLGHLRSEGPHVRGCWAVDVVLGRN